MLPVTAKEATRINTETGPIPVSDFSYFLYLFRAAYVAGIKASRNNFPNENFEKSDVKKLTNIVQENLLHKSKRDITFLSFYKLPPHEDLTILDIKRENPLDVIFGGISIAFAVAVILSGGKFELTKDGLKVELPSLGDGIRSLRDAFGEREI
ncbi:hypothetical protein MNB_SM-6-240 [hydrothermal vent metagenome]|uniref:Uncharacterized protein n=1 Tax=hydrothermal vent metagenome TaxID=652676 RepID=A0A1W1CIZ4_9ZZZZ